jgi:hypothetical protein
MIGGLRRFSYTGVLAALTIVVLAGCEQATGGGYIPTAEEGVEGKATFAFNGKCTNTTLENGDVIGEVKGQLQYNDRPADVKFHATLQGTVFTGTATPCEDQEANESTEEFAGEYRVSGGPKESEGIVDLIVADNGEPGINGDVVSIELIGGRYSGYTNLGTVQGGNVQTH